MFQWVFDGEFIINFTLEQEEKALAHLDGGRYCEAVMMVEAGVKK